jgi:hypothetical protein
MLFFQRFASDNQAKRRVVVHDYAAIAVEDAAAGGQDGDGFDAVGLRLMIVKFRILYLELPETGDQEQKDDHRSVLKNGYFSRREVCIVTQRGFIGEFLFEIGVNRRNDHTGEPPSTQFDHNASRDWETGVFTVGRSESLHAVFPARVRVYNERNMLRITLLALVASTCFAQTAAELLNKPPEDVDKALRARVEEFYGYHVSGQYRKAEALVAEDTKDYFYTNGKPAYLSCKIRDVKYPDDFQHAKVLEMCSLVLLAPGFTDKPVDMPIGSTWKIEDGKWVWYMSDDARRASPFGNLKMTPGPPGKDHSATAQGALPSIPSSADFIYNLVKVEKREVDVVRGAGTEITITNTAQGPMSVALNGKLQGVEATLDKTNLQANEKAVLSLKADVSAVSGTLEILVSPIRQVIPIQINVK